MRKLTNQSNTITIQEILECINTKIRLIIYYRASNERDGIPRFFKIVKQNNFTQCYFQSPIATDKYTYEALDSFEDNAITKALQAASCSREIYVVVYNEASKLFKVQP